MTLVLPLGGATRIHDRCARRHLEIILFSVHQLIIFTVYETLYITQIDHPVSKPNQTAFHIWVIVLKPGCCCDMEVEHLKFNISYLLQFKYKHSHIICEYVVVLNGC